MMIDSILVAIDGSENAFRALDLASELAAKYGARLEFIHAVSNAAVPETVKHYAEIEHIEGPPEQIVFKLAEQLMTDARQRALEAGAKKVDTLVESRDPAKAIIERSKEFDMIVMGRRGLGPIRGLLQGSVSLKVNQLADAVCVSVK